MRSNIVWALLTVLLLTASPSFGQQTAPAQDNGTSLEQTVGSLKQQMDDQRKAFDAKMQEMQSQMDAMRQQMDEERKKFDDRMQETLRQMRETAAAPTVESSAEAAETAKAAASVESSAEVAATAEAAPDMEPSSEAVRETTAAASPAVESSAQTAQPSAAEQAENEALAAEVAKAMAPQQQGAQQVQPPMRAAGPGQSMNPDISFIADVLGHLTSQGNKAQPGNEFIFREGELGLQSRIDPYAKADAFISVGEEPDGEFTTEVEEAYATFLTLPWELQMKMGRFRVDFGKTNPVHLHAIPWVQYPLVIQKFFGDDGLSGDGVSVSRLIPNPWDKYIELEYQLFNPNSESLYARPDEPTMTNLLHLKSFFDLSKSSTLEFGATGSGAPGTNGEAAYAEGLDATYKWKPTQEGLYKSFLFQNEIMASQKDASEARQDAWGAYSATEYQLSERWFAGARYDFTKLPENESLHENAGSGYLTFRQTEFCFWRFGYQYNARNYKEAGSFTDNQLWIQLDFAIGAHGAHKY